MSEPITDYSNFSMEAIEADLRSAVADVQKRTGATDEEMNAALAAWSQRFMETNFLKDPKERA